MILAIESAIAGGSLSLQSDGVEIENWIGKAGQAKAESLLVDIDRILKDSDLNISDIDLVAVAAGPGSFTGIRIGIATGLGLTAGLRINLASESALAAIAKLRSPEGRSVIAVPTGRDAICYQGFERVDGALRESGVPMTESFADLERRIHVETDGTFILHPDLLEKIDNPSRAIACSRNIAYAIGRACDIEPIPRVDPMFISKSF